MLIVPACSLFCLSENAYSTSHHFCYSKIPRAKQEVWYVPDELSVKVAKPGQDCAAACAESGQVCNPLYYDVINLCEVITDKAGFNCRFCKIKKKSDWSINGPAVKPVDGLTYWHGDCYQHKMKDMFSCDTNIEESYSRVCPCVKK